MKVASSPDQTDVIKNELIDRILIIGTTIGLGVFIISLFPLSEFQLNADFFYDIAGIGALFITYFLKKKLTAAFKTNMIIAMVFVLFVSDLLENGLHTPDSTLIVIIPFLSILIYNFRITILIYSFCMATFLVIGYLYVEGIISSPFYDSSNDSMFRWVEHVLVLSVVTFVITLFLGKFNDTVDSLINNLRNRNKELADRENLLAEILNNFPNSYLVVLDNKLNVVSIGGEEFHTRGFRDEDFIGRSVDDLLDQYDRNEHQIIINRYKKTFEAGAQEFEIKLSDEILKFKTQPLYNTKGEIETILAVSENITEQIRAKKLIEESLNEKNVLLQEIHHRVKNNLAVVSGLLQLQSMNVAEPRTKMILGKSMNRILSIAKVHEMLYEAKNFNRIPFDTYIHELSDIIMMSMNEENIDIDLNIDIDVEYLNINHGVPLGIIFNELITNSVKYGFQNKEGNTITINVKPYENNIHVTYEDNGIGIENFDAATSKSLGFTLIESLLTQIGAMHQFDTKNRFKLSFSFPADLDDKTNPISK